MNRPFIPEFRSAGEGATEGVSGNQEAQNKLRGSCPFLPSRYSNWKEGSFKNLVFQPFAWYPHQFHSLARSPRDIVRCAALPSGKGHGLVSWPDSTVG